MTDEETLNERRPSRHSSQRILVVISGNEADEELLSAAAEFVGENDAEIAILVTVEPPADISRVARATGISPNEIEERLREEKRRAIAPAIEKAMPGLRAEIHVRAGKAFVEIIRYVIAHAVDLVIKTAEELRSLHSHFFSSTDQHLLRKCPCPVWLRRRDSAASPKTVLAAVDIDEAVASEPETLAGLNRQIMDTAVTMVRGENAVIHVLHVWEAPGEGLVRMWSGTSDPERAAENYVSEVQLSHRKAVHDLVSQTRQQPGADKTVFIPTLKRGAPRRTIPEHAVACNADLLVMGTIARTGVPGFIIGNTAEDVLNSVECSVVTVKPPSYVSPLSG